MFSEISFPVFRPRHPPPAVTQTPSSLPFTKQTDYQNCAATRPNKPEPSDSLTSQIDRPHLNLPSVSKQEERNSLTTSAKPASQHSETRKHGQNDDVSKPSHILETAVNKERELRSTASIQSDTGNTKIHTDICKIHDDTKKSLEMRDDDDMKPSKNPSFNKQTQYTSSNIHTQSNTPDHNNPTKDEQLQEEERYLLAKIHLMTGDTSPASCPRSMKRLIPAPGDIDCDATEPKSQSEIPAEPPDHNQQSVIPCFDSLQEISLTEAEEPLGEEDV